MQMQFAKWANLSFTFDLNRVRLFPLSFIGGIVRMVIAHRHRCYAIVAITAGSCNVR